MKPDDFISQFFAPKKQKPKVTIEGEVLVEWGSKGSPVLRVLGILVPLLLLGGYYAFRFTRGERLKTPGIDIVITFVIIIFGSRLAFLSKKYALTTIGIFELLGTNWRKLGEWGEFRGCRRQEQAIILEKKKGFPRTVKLRCKETSKALEAVGVCNEQINKHRWS